MLCNPRRLLCSPTRHGITQWAEWTQWTTTCMAGVVLAFVVCLSLTAQAQGQNPFSARVERIEPGTMITVRTQDAIDVHARDGRVFTAVVEQGVPDVNGRLAIPRGSSAELMVRVAPDGDLILDLDSVVVNGERYAIRTDVNRLEVPERVGEDGRTGEFIGGGAILGTIVGAITGGGKGAVIGAAAGAAAGAGGDFLTRGRAVSVPRGSLLTFRLDRPLEVGVADPGYTRDGRHFHTWR